MGKKDIVALDVTSGLSMFDQRPFVNIVFTRENGESESFQVRPPKAREVAMMLLDCAEASVHEAITFEVASDHGKDKQTGGRMLMMLRERREHYDRE